MKKYRFLSFITAVFLMMPFISVCHAENDNYLVLSGDVNNDGIINILDAELLSYELIGIENESFNETNADLNHNEKIDIFDYVNLIMIILGMDCNISIEQIISENENNNTSEAECPPDNDTGIKETDISSGSIPDHTDDITVTNPDDTVTNGNDNSDTENISSEQPGVKLSEAETNAAAVFELINEIRINNGLKPFEKIESLDSAAMDRAAEISQKFSHKRPDDSSCFSILDEYDLFYMAAGENIASGSSTAEGVVNQWMNSQGHRDNILNPNYSYIGIGYYKAEGTNYCWSQLFIG